MRFIDIFPGIIHWNHTLEFVVAWENGKLDEAAAMVDERLRLAFRKEMARDPLRVEAIEKPAGVPEAG